MSRADRIVQFMINYDDYFADGLFALLKVARVAVMLVGVIVMAPFALLGWICKKCKGNAK